MNKLSKLNIFLIVLLSSIVILLVAFFYYKTETKGIIKDKHEFLKAVTDLKLEQLSAWKKGRTADAKFFATIGKFIKYTDYLKTNKNTSEAKEYFSKTLSQFTAEGYDESIVITDTSGKKLFSLDNELKQFDVQRLAEIKKCLYKDSVTYGNFYFNNDSKDVRLNIISIIKDNSGIPIGAFIQIINPNKSLIPIVQKFPSTSKTAETLLFKIENDSIIYINELRHKKNSALNLKISLSRIDIVAVKGVSGQSGIIEGKDYRGVDVLAELQPIPGTEWYMVSKIDKEELYSELFYRAGVISIIVFISILLIALTALFIYKQKQSRIYKNLFLKQKELAETQEEYRTALYSIGDGVITTDTLGAIKQMNLVAERLTGWSEKEAKGLLLSRVFNIVNEETGKNVENPVDRVLKDGVVVGLANHTILISKNGKKIPIADSGSPIRNDENKIIGVVLVFRDQTKEREKEKALFESNEKFSKIFLHSSDSISLTHLSTGKLTEINGGFEKIFGYSRSEVIGKTTFELKLWADSSDRVRMIELLKQNGYIKNFEAIGNQKNGKQITALLSGEILEFYDEQYLLLSIKDISERKKFEESLKSNEEKYRMLLDFASDAFFHGDKDGNFITVNNKAVELTGYSKEELIGMNIKDLFSKENLETIPLRYDKLLAGEIVKAERVVIKKDGKSIFIEMTSKLMPDGTYQSFMRDITEQKKAQIEFAASEEKFRKMTLNSPMGMHFYELNDNNDLILIDSNPAADKILGINHSLFLGKNIEQAFPPLANTEVPQRYRDAASKGILWATEQITYNDDKIEGAFEVKAYQTKPNFMVALFSDITQRKRAEEELKASEEKFTKAFLTSPDSININRLSDGMYISVNTGFLKLTGYTEKEVIGKSSFEINIWADSSDREKLVAGLKANGIVENLEARFRLKNGEVRNGLMSAAILELNGEKHILSITRDITERKLIQEKIRNSEANLNALINNRKESIWSIDKDYNYIVFNNFFSESYFRTYNIKLTKGLNALEILTPELKSFWKPKYDTALSGKKLDFEFSIETNNKFNYFQVFLNPIFSEGFITGVSALSVDVTGLKEAEEASLKTKTHYQKLIENAPDGIVQISEDGEFKYVSPSAKRIFGYSIEKRVEQLPAELTHPDDLPIVLGTLSAIIKNPALVPTIEYRFKNTKGNWLWIESTFTNLLNEPSVDAIVINFRDITERRKMEEAVQHSETKFYSLFENSPNAIFITDPETLLIIDCNANACSMNGYTREELIGKSINILHPQNVSVQLANSELSKDQIEILRLHKSVTIESVHKRKDGTVFPIESSISLISLSGKEVTMGIDRDITDRKKLLTEIIGSEQKFRSIWESSVDAMRLVDENGVIINVNDSYCNLFGLKKENLIGSIFNISYIITESENWISGFKERFKNRTILKKFETEIQLKSGKVIWVELTNSFIEFEDKAVMLLSIIRDITKRKVLITELTDAKEKAEEMNRLKAFFFANMSHELRTPFVGIMGFSEILAGSLQNDEEREMAEQILKSSKRLTDTLNKILNVTRLEFDKIDLIYKEFNVTQLLKSTGLLYSSSAKLKNTIITIVTEDQNLIVKSDQRLLEEILNNLVSNAVKFTENGTIKLIANTDLIDNQKNLIIKVEDTGIGIPKDKQSVVWYEFRQASEGLNRSFEGSGLGLTITKKYVEMLGGKISLESDENVGSSFTIKLPMNEVDLKINEHIIISSDTIKPSSKKPQNKKSKILYVEDDTIALNYISIVLKSLYDVKTAFSAKAALEQINSTEYDILMLDINLGKGMDGVELMQKIRQIDIYKTTPIVAVTAYAAQSDKEEFLAKGFTHYISKPFTSKELKDLLNKVLG
ncbi:MAG: PAS domain S-box protein [Ignavibacteriales bacterium]|nr:PAS domain S-box protein [Ignavibacteriales bacterium]